MNPTQPLVDQLKISAGQCAAIKDYCDGIGIEMEPIARAVGLDPKKFGALDERVSLDRVCRLLEALAALANDETFGLMLGQAYKRGSSGSFGYGFMHAPTLHEALTFVDENIESITDMSHQLIYGEQETRFEWTYSPLIVSRDQFADMGAAIIMRHVRPMLGQHLSAIKVELERKKPKSISTFREIFGSGVSFGAPINAFVFPTASLASKNPDSDPTLFKVMSQQCEPLRRQPDSGTGLLDRVQMFLLDTIDRPVTLAETARATGVSERTLQRRLSDSGTSFQGLLDDVRRELAERLLTETQQSISQIAYKLGFSAPSAFTRSYIRWHGKPPSAARKPNR